jgi:hypothetical protein
MLRIKNLKTYTGIHRVRAEIQGEEPQWISVLLRISSVTVIDLKVSGRGTVNYSSSLLAGNFFS